MTLLRAFESVETSLLSVTVLLFLIIINPAVGKLDPSAKVIVVALFVISPFNVVCNCNTLLNLKTSF